MYNDQENSKVIKLMDDEHYLWILLHLTIDSIFKCEEIASSKAGMTREKYNIMMAIRFHNLVMNEPAIVTNLASSLSRSTTSISTLIDRMEKEGFIKKIRDIPDRRAIRIMLTPKAESAFRKAVKLHIELIEKLFIGFSHDEVQLFISLVKKLKHNANIELGHVQFGAEMVLHKHSKLADLLRELNEPD